MRGCCCRDGTSAASPTTISNSTVQRNKESLLMTNSRSNPDIAWLQDNMSNGFVEERYETKTLLGRGAYATVHSAANRETRSWFAVKCIDFENVPQDRREKTISQITAETRIHLAMKHEAIMRLEEFFLTRTKIHLVLELMRGGSLLDLILERGGLKEGEAQIVFREILRALKYLHSKNIIHRDIKLENVMLGEVNDLQSAKLADFGFAIDMSASGSKQELGLAGTPVYLAPEAVDVMLGERDVKSVLKPALDVWAAGVALYMLVGGFPPFEGKSSKEIFRKIHRCEVSFQAPAWQNVSRDCIGMIERLLTREPKKRITAAEALEHPWMNRSIKTEDFSQTLLPTQISGPREPQSVKGVQKLNSNKMDESIYIKKSPMLEIQERHQQSLGRGMDMSLLRIFGQNKNKVKPKKPAAEPSTERTPSRRGSLATLFEAVAGPPRFESGRQSRRSVESGATASRHGSGAHHTPASASRDHSRLTSGSAHASDC